MSIAQHAYLLVKDRLSLTTITLLLSVVTTLTLGERRGLTRLVLGHSVESVLSALGRLAKSFALLRNVDHLNKNKTR